jgi:hypothetical protein
VDLVVINVSQLLINQEERQDAIAQIALASKAIASTMLATVWQHLARTARPVCLYILNLAYCKPLLQYDVANVDSPAATASSSVSLNLWLSSSGRDSISQSNTLRMSPLKRLTRFNRSVRSSAEPRYLTCRHNTQHTSLVMRQLKAQEYKSQHVTDSLACRLQPQGVKFKDLLTLIQAQLAQPYRKAVQVLLCHFCGLAEGVVQLLEVDTLQEHVAPVVSCMCEI